jgi:thymidylate synthase
MTKTFHNANTAYNYYFDKIIRKGVAFGDTKALFNVGFYLLNPMKNEINNRERKWNPVYAEAEWQWYLSGDRNIAKLGELYGKVPEIWKRMADSNGDVNSNYGWQWKRNDQIDYVIDLLRNEPDTRQAAISIYDCKEHDTFTFDTPCTYAVQFTILDNKLNMSVVMRSNDLWFGFCNDQYQFSKLQHYVWNRLKNKDVEIGTYFHFAHNLHLYNDKI